MRRKIVTAFFLLFLVSSLGAVFSIVYVRNVTNALGRLIELHQIEGFRKNLIISIQTVQSGVYTIRTVFGQKIEGIISNVASLDENAQKCTGCHHTPEVENVLLKIQENAKNYENALSYYITASAGKQHLENLKSEAVSIGNSLLKLTEEMSAVANRKLESARASVKVKISKVQTVLIATLLATFAIALFIATKLTSYITTPVRLLVNASRAIAAGNLGETVDYKDKTELGELTAHFNLMSAALKDGYESLLREITERKYVEEALRISEERYALAAQGANDGLWDWDLTTNKIYFSSRWKSMLGYSDAEIGDYPEEWLGRIYEDDRKQLEAQIAAHIRGKNGNLEFECRIRHADGSCRWVLIRGMAVRDKTGKAHRMAGSQTDITARKVVEDQLLHDAFHDALTGLPNRALFMDRLSHLINSSRRRKDFVYAVLFMDIDRFKFINDSLGHLVGDKLLIEAAKRFLPILRPEDTVARFGGDEFAVILENIKDNVDVSDVAERVQKGFLPAFNIEGHEIHISLSIGITLQSFGYEKPEQVLRDADIAMYQAKSRGKDRYEFFESAMHSSIVERLQLEADLRRAVENKQELIMYYQPIINIKTNKLMGFEALIRWIHPKRGLILPTEFIPLAEETGIIHSMGEFIIREVLAQLMAWQTKFNINPPLKISFNVSSKQFMDPHFADNLAKILKEMGADPDSLVVEITESIIMQNTDTAISNIEKLHAMGVRLHIDDFGTGYSSLSYLHRFPVDALKIDRSFIERMSHSDEDKEIVNTIVMLAQNLNMEVIAEGIEHSEQLAKIKTMDCHYAQGFLFSRPMAPKDIEEWYSVPRNLDNSYTWGGAEPVSPSPSPAKFSPLAIPDPLLSRWSFASSG